MTRRVPLCDIRSRREYVVALEINEDPRLARDGLVAAHATVLMGGSIFYVGKTKSEQAVAELTRRAINVAHDPPPPPEVDNSDWK